MRKKANPVRLQVDPVACTAVGLCTLLAPDVVDLDRWGYPIVPTGALPADQVRAARRAVRACPRRALSLSEAASAGRRDPENARTPPVPGVPGRTGFHVAPPVGLEPTTLRLTAECSAS